MTPREELAALRRLAELEAKSRGELPADPIAAAHAGAVNPTEGMTRGALFSAGMGKAFADLGRGVEQLPRPGDLVDRSRLDRVQAEIDEARQLEAPLMGHGSGVAGNFAGNLAALAPAAGIPGVTVTGSALLGLGSGFVQPVASGDSRLMNTAAGGVAGAVLPAAVRALKVGKAAAEPLYEGGRNQIIARALRRAAGPNAAQVEQRLAGAQELVPGSAPTAAEVSGNANIAAMQRAVAAADPEAYAARAAQQNEARVAQLRELAGTGGEREFHGSARDATAKQLYDEAYSKGVDIRRDPTTGHFRPKAEVRGVKGEIVKLLQRPAMKKAVEQARVLAANEGHTKIHPLASVRGLDYTKRALDDMIKKSDGNEARVLTGLKERLLTTVDKLSPKYAEARQTFRDMSRPINQMDIAQEVADKSINPLTGVVQPQALARSLSDDTAARATGFNRATLAGVMEPDQLARLGAVRDDLARSVEARDLGRGPGSNTFQNFAMGNMLEQAGVPSFVRGMTLPQVAGGVVGRVGSAVYSDAEQAMRQRLAQALLNPQDAAALMRSIRQLTPEQRRVIEALHFGSSAAPIAALQSQQ